MKILPRVRAEDEILFDIINGRDSMTWPSQERPEFILAAAAARGLEFIVWYKVAENGENIEELTSDGWGWVSITTWIVE